MTSIAAGHTIAGKYQLERPLAKGGMGAVWVARHLQLGTEVALKLMDPALASSADARARFEREARAAAMLKGSHVVAVHDYGIDGEVPYIAMELLEGEDLESRLARVGKLGVSATARIVAQVAKALRRAHEAGLVHRDLKPGNVFLARLDDEEVVKVLDFGIAKILGLEVTSSSTRTGMILGSPHYMSPEQVRRSRRVDHRSDLWALGVIAFRCLTGSLPFDSDELGELLVEICTAPIPSPSLFESTLSGDVDRFMARALARDPEERFQSARELSEACAALGGADAPPTPIPPRRTSPDQPTVYARAATAGVRPSITPSTPATATAASIPGATRPRRGWIAAGGALGAVAAIGAALLLRGRAPASPSIAAAAHATTVLAAAPPPPAPLPPPPSVVASAEAPAEPSKSETPAPRVAPSAPRAASPSVARPAQSAKVTPAAKKEPAEKPYDPTREM